MRCARCREILAVMLLLRDLRPPSREMIGVRLSHTSAYDHRASLIARHDDEKKGEQEKTNKEEHGTKKIAQTHPERACVLCQRLHMLLSYYVYVAVGNFKHQLRASVDKQLAE